MEIRTQTERYFFFLFLALITILAYMIVAPVFSAIVFAFLTSLIFQPVYEKILKITRNRLRLSSVLTMVIIFLTLLLPLILLVQLTIQQIIQFNNDIRTVSSEWDTALDTIVLAVNDNLYKAGLGNQQITIEGLQDTINQTITEIARQLLNFLLQISGRSIEVLAQFFIYIFLLYFFIPMQSKIPNAISKFSPLDDEIDKMFITKTQEMAKSMIRGTFVIAIIQSILGGLVLALFGTNYVIFWVILMTFLGIMPIVGPSLVMIPAGLIYLLLGNYFAGITILVLNAIFISNVDNFLRPKLVSKLADLHPVLVLIGVLGGLKAFGALGVIYGPVIMILFISLLQVYKATRGKSIKSSQVY